MKKALLSILAGFIFCVAVSAQSEIFVSVSNNLSATPRENETVVLDWNELLRLNPSLKPDFVKVSDSNGGAALVSQAIDADANGIPEKLIFQVSFLPSEKAKRIKIEATGERQTAAATKTFARFVPERMDDFAWENDRIAFRTYGKALEKEMISSGIDVWTKRVPGLIIDNWYKAGDKFYHEDNGTGLDFYSVKRSRGCGGAGIWDGAKMHVSRNFVSSRVLANGPIRTVFELRYEPWNVGGVMVSETKRITIDAGQNFYRVESFYDAPDDLRDIDVAIGIAKHEPDFTGEFATGKTWMSLWETNEKNGSLGCAVIADAQNFQSFKDIPAEQFDFPQHLALVAAKPDKVARYWVGAGWSRFGFADKTAWLTTVNNFAQRTASPLVVSVVNDAEIKRKQAMPISQRLAYTLMNRIWLEDDGTPVGIPAKWNYEQGVQMKAVEQVWYATGDARYYDFIKRGMDYWFDQDGKLARYDLEEYNIDHVTPGRGLITLYRVSGDKKYREAIDLIRSQLKTHPRTKEGGFWHKKIYPWQMWLDGLYMGQPFYAEYSALTGEDNWNDIANQFVWMEKHARDPKTGLLYHGWDESKEQKWANKQTGLSPHVWGRAMGWYAIALVDVLDSFPKNHPRRSELVAILNREAEAIAKYQDKKSGVWYDIVDLSDRPKNYLESSVSAMFVYSLAKGVRQGNLPEKYLDTARKGWAGIKKEFIKELADGNLDWEGTVSVSGLGGNPYRDGSFDYYMSEKLRTNDAKGLGPAVMAAVEMEALETGANGRGKTVLLDSYFNNETKKDAAGREVSWHYKWDEMNHPGFALWGRQFEMQGARLDTLYQAPTAQNLSAADVYIIVDPDDAKENPAAKFISGADAKTIADWVKKGGVLVMFGNDLGNAEFDNWNVLAREFGIEFNKNSLNRVQGNQFEQGRIEVSGTNEIFRTARKLYLKEISTLKLSGKAKSLLDWNGETVMATVKYGKGTVFAVGDPWLYNEYTDGRKLPADFQNFQAAQDLSSWLLRQTRQK